MNAEPIKIIENHIKICSECKKEFLGIVLEAYEEHGKCRADITKYPLKCNKCPSCALKCFEEKYKKSEGKADEMECNYMQDEFVNCYIYLVDIVDPTGISDEGNLELVDFLEFFNKE